MIKETEAFEAEELSQCLDMLNCNGQPVVQDEEVKECIALAAAIKKSYSQKPPKELIARMADELAAELQKKQDKRRRYWVYGGFSSAAAAVVIAAFMQFLQPHAPDPYVALQDGKDTTVQQPAAMAAPPAASNPNVQGGDTSSEKVTRDIQQESPASQPAEEKAAASMPTILTAILQNGKSTETEQQSTQIAALQQEMPKEAVKNKSVAIQDTSRSSKKNQRALPKEKITMIWVIPNETAQLIKIDNVQGVVQQRYVLGNHDELIVTQSVADNAEERRKMSLKQEERTILKDNAMAEDSNLRKELHNVTVRIEGYDVTITGTQTIEQLKKIADSLVAREFNP